MRITSWAIVFVMIIFSFSFANRMLVNNKMEIVKEEVKYNNAIDLATMDATRDMMENMINLGTGNRESFYSVLSSVDTFFESFGLTLGYYGGDEKQTALKTYIPVVAVLANEGFYICSLEDLQKKEGANTIYYKEHALKPRIPYSVEDKTPLLATLNGTKKVRYPAEGVYINYTMGNEIKIYDSKKNKKMIEGVIVDTRHYKDLMETEEYDPQGIEEILPDGTKVNFTCMYSNDVYSKEGTYKGNAIYYEKSFYKVNNIRYLYEEWYINDILVEKRTTEYTEEAYNFTKSIENLGIALGTNDSYYSLAGNYLTQGNPENTGMIDPFTGIYTIGEFHRIKNEAITNIVKEKLASYIVLHNRYLQMNNITYTFSLPNISTQDWSRAISDVSVFAFVQGIPMLGETYYNNYGLSGAQIVERNVFYAYPGLRPDLQAGTVSPTSTEFPTYYSNYDFSSDAKYLLEANGARIYYTAQAAAMAGYFPNIHSNDLVGELDIDTNALDVELRYDRNNQVAVFGATGTTTYGPIVLTYEIIPRLNEPIYLQQASYMHSKYSSMNYTKNRILNGGIAIGLNSYDSYTRVGTFLVDQNGTYIMAIREFGGITERSNKLTLNLLEGINFTIKAKPITYARDSNGTRHAVVIIEGSDTPIFSKVEWVKKDARDKIKSMTTVNSERPTAILHIYKDGTYTIQATNGFGDRMATTNVTIEIPNASPTVYIEREPNKNLISVNEDVNISAISEDADGDPLTYKWEQSIDGGNTWTTLSTTSSSLPQKKYTSGNYVIKVTVTDEYGGIATAQTTFEVKNTAPVVDITNLEVYEWSKNVEFDVNIIDEDSGTCTLLVQHFYKSTESAQWVEQTKISNWITVTLTNGKVTLPYNDIFEQGYHRIVVQAKDAQGEYSNTDTVEFQIINRKEVNFAYTGNVQTITLPKGRYKLEAWGSAGAGTLDGTGGRGGYTSGVVELDETTTLYVYIGGNSTTNNLGTGWHTFNGGGGGQAPGGGASDFRLVGGNWYDTNSLRSRILVAGGGGGGERCYGGAGGTTTGQNGYTASGYGSGYGTGGTQTSGGRFTGSIYGGYGFKYTSSGSFGMGASGESTDSGSGGGGGYYGGGSITYANGGGGGSSFVTGHTGCDTTYRSFQGGYTFTDVVMDRGVNTGVGKAKITKLPDVEKTFVYTGSVQTITLQKGTYKFEAWGAQGGGGTWSSLGGSAHPGQGGYTTGTIKLNAQQTFYIYVGAQGNTFNGGGDAYIGPDGGGASDIRTKGGAWNDLTSLKSRILVAGGGGGDEWGYSKGGAGGGLTGGSGTPGRTGNGQVTCYGGSQTSGGSGYIRGTFGSGGKQTNQSGSSGSVNDTSGGGGGGYYGGGTGKHSGGGGGGSSYVNGHTGCDRTYYQSGYTFTDVRMDQGGNVGNGKVKITQID